MRNILYTLILTVLLASCGTRSVPDWFCYCDEQREIAEFISKNTKSSNNMSDEEMEDVILQLRKEGVKSFCHQKMVVKSRGDMVVNWDKTDPLDSCEVYIGQW